MGDYRAATRDFHSVIPAKAGIQKAADAKDEPKIAANAICQHCLVNSIEEVKMQDETIKTGASASKIRMLGAGALIVIVALISALIYRDVSLGQEIEEMTTRAETLEAEKAVLSGDLAAKEAENAAMSANIAALRAERSELTVERNSLADENRTIASENRLLASEQAELQGQVDDLTPLIPPVDADWNWVETTLNACMTERFGWALAGDYDIEHLRAFTGLEALTQDIVVEWAKESEEIIRDLYELDDYFEGDTLAAVGLMNGMRDACWDLDARGEAIR